jgi:hypothetical protein
MGYPKKSHSLREQNNFIQLFFLLHYLFDGRRSFLPDFQLRTAGDFEGPGGQFRGEACGDVIVGVSIC